MGDVEGDGFCLIELTNGGFTRVSPGDYEALTKFKWYKYFDRSGTYYARCTKKGNPLMHRMVMGFSKGDGRMCDHRNGDGLDNRQTNLREATGSQNQQNSRAKGGFSRYKGVSWHKRDKYWYARIWYMHQHINLGCFRSRIVAGVDVGELAAGLAYDEAALKYFGEYARLNFKVGEVSNELQNVRETQRQGAGVVKVAAGVPVGA